MQRGNPMTSADDSENLMNKQLFELRTSLELVKRGVPFGERYDSLLLRFTSTHKGSEPNEVRLISGLSEYRTAHIAPLKIDAERFLPEEDSL